MQCGVCQTSSSAFVWPPTFMFSVNHAVIGADGSIRVRDFKMTKAKSDGFDTPTKLDRFLRTKLENKGLHTQWKRYGSWTFTDDDGFASHLYAWSTTKGTLEHGYVYSLDESRPPLAAFDDLLLLRFPEDNDQLSLHQHLPITPDHVKEWLECVLPADEAAVVAPPKHPPKKGGASSKPKKTQKAPKSTSAGAEVVETMDEPNASDEEEESNVLDVDEEDATAEDENILEDALDDNENNKELLLEEYDDDEEDGVSDDETAKMSDEEEDDFESAFDTDMLQCEAYTYDKSNKRIGQPLLLSLWTH